MSATLQLNGILSNAEGHPGFPEIPVNEFERAFKNGSRPLPELIYLLKTGLMPSVKRYLSVDKEAVISTLCRHFNINRQSIPTDVHVCLNRRRSHEAVALVFLLEDVLVTTVEYADDLVVLAPPGKRMEELAAVERNIFDHPAHTNGMHVLSWQVDGYALRPCTVDSDLASLEKYFNDDLVESDKLIREKLSDFRNRGIVLLHGMPGTGKTTYLKHLLSTLDKKSVVVPTDFIQSLNFPAVISLLHRTPDIIIVCEDIDDFVMEGNILGTSWVTNVANYTDSVLSHYNNVRFLFTCSQPPDKLAKPLTRSGRIMASYEFKPLTVEKCNALLAIRYPGCTTDHEMTLADVINYHEKPHLKGKNGRIGFAL